jgi:hypothetical protein
MSVRITLQVDTLPEVEVDDRFPGTITVGGWVFDGGDLVPTAEDVAAFAVAKAWFEAHPETVVGLDDE